MEYHVFDILDGLLRVTKNKLKEIELLTEEIEKEKCAREKQLSPTSPSSKKSMDVKKKSPDPIKQKPKDEDEDEDEDEDAFAGIGFELENNNEKATSKTSDKSAGIPLSWVDEKKESDERVIFNTYKNYLNIDESYRNKTREQAQKCKNEYLWSTENWKDWPDLRKSFTVELLVQENTGKSIEEGELDRENSNQESDDDDFAKGIQTDTLLNIQRQALENKAKEANSQNHVNEPDEDEDDDWEGLETDTLEHKVLNNSLPLMSNSPIVATKYGGKMINILPFQLPTTPTMKRKSAPADDKDYDDAFFEKFSDSDEEGEENLANKEETDKVIALFNHGDNADPKSILKKVASGNVSRNLNDANTAPDIPKNKNDEDDWDVDFEEENADVDHDKKDDGVDLSETPRKMIKGMTKISNSNQTTVQKEQKEENEDGDEDGDGFDDLEGLEDFASTPKKAIKAVPSTSQYGGTPPVDKGVKWNPEDLGKLLKKK